MSPYYKYKKEEFCFKELVHLEIFLEQSKGKVILKYKKSDLNTLKM